MLLSQDDWQGFDDEGQFEIIDGMPIYRTDSYTLYLDVTMIELPTREAADAVLLDPIVAPLIHKRIGDTKILVGPNQAAALCAHLQECGYAIRLSSELDLEKDDHIDT
jgi:hypothetical protein